MAGPAARWLVVVLLLRRCVGLLGRALGWRVVLVVLLLLVLLGVVVWVRCCWGLAVQRRSPWAGWARGGVVARLMVGWRRGSVRRRGGGLGLRGIAVVLRRLGSGRRATWPWLRSVGHHDFGGAVGPATAAGCRGGSPPGGGGGREGLGVGLLGLRCGMVVVVVGVGLGVVLLGRGSVVGPWLRGRLLVGGRVGGVGGRGTWSGWRVALWVCGCGWQCNGSA